MNWLFAEPAPIAWPIAGLTLATLSLVAAWTARRRAARLAGSVLQLFWQDSATIAVTMAAALAVPSLASIVPVEGIGQPIWIVGGVIAVIAASAVLAARWRGQELGRASRIRRVTPTGAPERRLVSTAWEFGMLGGGVGLLGTYLATADHAFGHPIHWVIAILGLSIGYALGVSAVTPRFRLEAPPGRRS